MVDVIVPSTTVTSTTSAADRFTYARAPSVSAVSPVAGLLASASDEFAYETLSSVTAVSPVAGPPTGQRRLP